LGRPKKKNVRHPIWGRREYISLNIILKLLLIKR
jgi:hypothetical protein